MFCVSIPGIQIPGGFKSFLEVECLVKRAICSKHQPLYPRNNYVYLQIAFKYVPFTYIVTGSTCCCNCRVITIFNIRSGISVWPVGRHIWLAAHQHTENRSCRTGGKFLISSLPSISKATSMFLLTFPSMLVLKSYCL